MSALIPCRTLVASGLPRGLCHQAASLFDLSLWLLGRDSCHPGDLLARHGLSRTQRPEGALGTSRYSTPEGRVSLWGFGAVVQQTQCAPAVLIDRAHFRPAVVVDWQPANVFHTTHLGPVRPPSCLTEMVHLAQGCVAVSRWFSGYEHWVEQTVPGWRAACFSSRTRKPRFPPEELPQRWNALAACFASITHSPEGLS